jgi:2-dehydro-3-deoxygalactonokinase
MAKVSRCIAVDWGTTNRRAYALNAQGEVVDRLADGRGVLSIERNGFHAAVDEIRFALGDGLLLLAGMIGSNRGWVEAPYVDCPAGLDTLCAGLKFIDGSDAAIVPGVRIFTKWQADVMRGEEVQVLGAAAAGLIPETGLVCHPGTHSKWVLLGGGAIGSFRSVMTGELFALLKKHSILSEQLHAPVSPGASFLEGVGRSLSRCELTADLFTVRARGLLGELAPEDAAAFASGLLVGADLRIGLALAEEDHPIALVGDPHLTGLYAAALGEAGKTSTEVDGEQAFLAGIRLLLEKL